MVVKLIASLLVLLGCFVAALFILRHKVKKDLEAHDIRIQSIGASMRSQDQEILALRRAFLCVKDCVKPEAMDGMFKAMKANEAENRAELEREIASIREEIRQLKVQRDELEREERKVLDGMNNIMNYGFDVARKAARDGGEG